MLRWSLNAILSLLLILSLGLAPEVGAQTKAYAPEDLSGLAVPDRIRVIEREYADHSNGRRIPDDQLEFYLAQIESGWSFSHIKQDIAKSLGGGAGGGGGWTPGPGPAPVYQEILCESRDARYVECATPFRGAAMLSRQISSTRCVEGANFGSRPGLVWVRAGCRARFVEDDRYVAPPVFASEIVCESRSNRLQECRTNFRGRAVLTQQISGTPCIEGRNWGSRQGLVWVNAGCRARFADSRGGGVGGGRGAEYSVTCASNDNRYTTCAWNANAGRPYLLEQSSRTACIEDRTWGYDRREGLWVDRGCRGRFGASGY